MPGLKVTGLDKLQSRLREISNTMETKVDSAMRLSAETVRDRWQKDAKALKLDETYYMSIGYTTEPEDGYYVGPSKTYVATQRGILDFEDIQEGDYITYIARCMVHKYPREVKRRQTDQQLNQYALTAEMEAKMEEYKTIIKDIITTKLNNIMRGIE